MPIETVTIDALDGVRLQADLVRLDEPVGQVVLSHPHPLYGGDRFNPIVDSLFHALPEAGFNTIRFDFRGVNESEGLHDDGNSERLDVVAAIELLEFAEPNVATWLVGYSFGAFVALNVVDPRVAGWIAIAPPLAHVGGRCVADTDPRPKLILVPRHDQYSPPDATAPLIDSWASTTMRVIEGADHFLGGRVGLVCDEVLAELASLTARDAHRPIT